MPYCSVCLRHAGLWDSSVPFWVGALTFALGWYCFDFAGARGVSFVAGLVVMIALKTVLRRQAEAACKSSCVTPAWGANFVGWHGTIHTFNFSSPHYMADFARMHERKIVSESQTVRQLRLAGPTAYSGDPTEGVRFRHWAHMVALGLLAAFVSYNLITDAWERHRPERTPEAAAPTNLSHMDAPTPTEPWTLTDRQGDRMAVSLFRTDAPSHEILSRAVDRVCQGLDACQVYFFATGSAAPANLLRLTPEEKRASIARYRRAKDNALGEYKWSCRVKPDAPGCF